MSHDFLYYLSTIGARTAIVALALIAGLRFLGKRQLGQMNIYDLAMIMALANAVQNAITNGNGNLSIGIVTSGTLFLIGWGLTLLFVRLPKLEAHIVGTPTLLIHDGQLVPDALRRECVTQEQIRSILRQHGLSDIHEVLLATLEVDGTISIVPKSAPHSKIQRHASKVPAE